MLHDPRKGSDEVTLHGVPSSGQLNVKSLATPSPSAVEVVDFRPFPADSTTMVAKKKIGAPGAKLDLSERSFQVPTNGSAAPNRRQPRMQRVHNLEGLTLPSKVRMQPGSSRFTKFFLGYHPCFEYQPDDCKYSTKRLIEGSIRAACRYLLPRYRSDANRKLQSWPRPARDKEWKISRGIFTIRIGSVWVESSRDLDAAEKRTFFLLRSGDVQVDKTAAAEFREHGQDAFTYEVLEKLDEDVAELAIGDLISERKRHWLATLSARPLWPV